MKVTAPSGIIYNVLGRFGDWLLLVSTAHHHPFMAHQSETEPA